MGHLSTCSFLLPHSRIKNQTILINLRNKYLSSLHYLQVSKIHIKKSFEDIQLSRWLSGVCLGSQHVLLYLHVFVFWSVCGKKKDSVHCVVTVCSALPSRTPETSLEMEKEAATSAWSSAELQWVFTEQTEDTGIPYCASGNGWIRGKLGHAAWAGERIVRSCSGSIYKRAEESSDRTNSSPALRSDFSTIATGQRHVAPHNFCTFVIMVLIWTQFGVKHKNVNVKCKVRVMHRGDSSGSSSSAVSWTNVYECSFFVFLSFSPV